MRWLRLGAYGGGRACGWTGGPAGHVDCGISVSGDIGEAGGHSRLESMGEVWASDINLKELINLHALFYSFDFSLLHSK